MSELSDFKHEYPIYIEQDVVWGDMDAFQHVNNTRYFRYFEDIRLKFFEITGVMVHMEKTKEGPILAATECQFKAPLAYPDRISIGTKLRAQPSLGEKRFTMEYAVFSHQQEKVVATGSGLVVFYDYQQGKSCAIPHTLIESFKLHCNRAKH